MPDPARPHQRQKRAVERAASPCTVTSGNAARGGRARCIQRRFTSRTMNERSAIRRSRAQVHVRAGLVPGDSRSVMVVGNGFRRIASLCRVPRRTDRHCRISQASNSRLLRTTAGRQGAPNLPSPDVGATEAREGSRRHVECWIVPSWRERQASPVGGTRHSQTNARGWPFQASTSRRGPTRVGRDAASLEDRSHHDSSIAARCSGRSPGDRIGAAGRSTIPGGRGGRCPFQAPSEEAAARSESAQSRRKDDGSAAARPATHRGRQVTLRR